MPQQCERCGNRDRRIYLHHGDLLCAMCLRPSAIDNWTTEIHISILRAEEARREAKRLRKK